MPALEQGNLKSPELSVIPGPFQGEQTVLILVGLIASGKSTFATALENNFPVFQRCNQDDLGNRRVVEELAYRTLSEGRSPCIDRTNFNAIQRSYWTAIARAFPGTSVSIIVFDTPYQVCASRLERRTSHPTIRDAQHGMAVLQKFASELTMPSADEGYDHIIHLRPADHARPEYTRDDILSILARLKASTRDAGSGIVRHPSFQPHSMARSLHSRNQRARGYREFSATRGIVNDSAPSQFVSRVADSSSSGAITNRDGSDHRSATAANAPAKEGSKGGTSAEERHNSS